MKWMFDHKPSDVFWCTADVGWVTGHTYIAYGPLAVRRDRDRVRGRAHLSGRGPLLEDDPGPQGHGLLHRADGDPLAHQGRRRPAEEVRPLAACASSAPSASRSIPRRGCGTTAIVGGERCPIVDTWWQTETGGHMITPLPGVTPTKPGSCTLPLPGIMAGDRRRDRPGRREGQGRHPRHQASVAVDDPHHLGRPRALQEELLPRGLQGQVLPRGRRRQPRHGRLLLDHGPHRRRAERLGPPPGHDGDRVGAGGQPDWWPRPRWSAVPTTSPARRCARSWCSSGRARRARRR